MKVFWRLLGFLRPYRRGVAASLLLAAAAMAMGVLIPFLVGRTVDEIRGGAASLWPLALAIVAAGLLRLALTVARRLVAARVSLGVEYDLRNGLYAHLQELELDFFAGQQTGQLMSRATVDLQAVRFFLGYGLVFITQSALTLLLAAGAMVIVSPQLAALALAPTPLIVWAAARYGRRNRPALQEVQQRIAELTADAEENISGVRVVKAFAREGRQLERFGRRVGRVFDQSMRSTRLRAFYNPLIAFLPSLGVAAILLVGGRQVVAGAITLGEFVAFNAYVLMLASPIRMLGIALGMAQRAVAAGARMFEVLDRQPRLSVVADAPAVPRGDGRVQLEGVTFAYDGTEPVLRALDLEVEAGRTVALVGPTGAGKTTLVALVPRLYDAAEGRVLVDGADVRSVDPHTLRRQIALVSDDPFLFSASVRENIAYARPDATEEQIEGAARRAGIHGFVAALPEGYETMVGERGLTLSGGQRQRMAIARALLREPRILILDDATSSVDATTEREIQQALGEVMRGRTTFVIGHRLSTIALADEIVVLDRGRIVARGSHAELLESSELYREIVQRGARTDPLDQEADRAGDGDVVTGEATERGRPREPAGAGAQTP